MAYQYVRRTHSGNVEAGRSGGGAVSGLRRPGISNSALCDMLEARSRSSRSDAGAAGSETASGTAVVQMKRPGDTEGRSERREACLSAIRSRLEASTGIRLDDVKVHYNSDKPKKLGALAYTKGSEIFMGPGQEKSLPHEMTHVVQQKQGLVQPTGSVDGVPVNTSPALERAADQMSTDIPAGFSPSPSAASSGGVVQGHKLDVKGMDFDNESYQKDKEYQAIRVLMEYYNKDQNQLKKTALEAQLMNAAMDYIEKASGGKKARHKGRTAKLEEMLYQLSMKDGTAQKADENAEALRQANQNSNQDENMKQRADATFQHLKGVYGQNSPYSRTMQMITAGVLADQNASGASAPEYDPSPNDKAAADVQFAPGSSGYNDKHNYYLKTRVSSDMNDSAANTLHELTHVATGEVYNNSGGMLAIGENASEKEILEKYKRRVKTVAELNKTLNEGRFNVKRVSGTNLGSTMDAKTFLREKLEYATMNNVTGAANGQDRENYKNIIKPYAQKQAGEGFDEGYFNMNMNIDWKRAVGDYLNIEGEGVQNYLRGLGLRPETLPDDFHLSEEDQQRFKTHSEMIEKLRAYDTLIDNKSVENQETIKQVNEINKKNKSLDYKYQLKKTGANALMEYDTVMNQMLFQYENAGQNGQPKDRDSQFYRQLRNAALRAHLERRIHKLWKQLGVS